MGNSDSKEKKKGTPPKAPQPPTPTIPLVYPPRQFMTKDDFFENWPLWKKSFLQYKASLVESTQIEWDSRLLNLMGPIGHEICTSIKSPYERMDLTKLLREFDEYSVFAEKRRLPRENIYEYMDNLQEIVKNKKLQHGEDVIRQRILVEINESKFTNAAKKFIPTFVFSSTYKKLTIKQIAFLWDFYITEKNCKNCGHEHVGPNSCAAIGKQCKRCNKFGHYTIRCPSVFIYSCKYCGGMHRKKQCPAYNETCIKCKRPNHFDWKCQMSEILQCRFCDMSHPAERSVCPAYNTYCLYCSMKGHFSSKCNRRTQPGRI